MIGLQSADKRQELLTLREHMGSLRGFGCVRVAHHFSLLYCAFCFVCLRLVYTMLSVSLDGPFLIATFDFLTFIYIKHYFIYITNI